MSGYPIMLNLAGKRCVVVGGGQVAERKVTGLLEAGAAIVVISPQLTDNLTHLTERGAIDYQRGVFAAGMLANLRPLLVFAATDSSPVNRQVVSEAHELNILVNAVDSSEADEFNSMAVTRRGTLTIALSTGGTAPALLTHLRERIEAIIGEEYAILAEWMAAYRPLVKARVESGRDRRLLWHNILNSPILELLRQGDEAAARALLERMLDE
jgi:siroheme synthase-like protein